MGVADDLEKRYKIKYLMPVGIEIKRVPTVELLMISFSPKLITTGKVTIPANRPTAVSMPATANASLGIGFLLLIVWRVLQHV